jgi:hypothetical protein
MVCVLDHAVPPGLAARLVWWRLCGSRAEPDADALHVLMGAAMAGMFEPRISPCCGSSCLRDSRTAGSTGSRGPLGRG